MSFKGFRSYTRALLFLILLPGSWGLRNASLIIPEAAERGQPVVIKCLYVLENENLYQVKWYKGEKEFCRYTPREVPPLTIFPIPGIEVNRERSDAKRLTISAATQRAQGRYTCEISVGAPSFTTVQLHGFIMYVVDLPNSCPNFILRPRQYKPGMKIKAECTCRDSMPPVNISFYVNNKTAPSRHVRQRVSGGENGSLWTAYSSIQFIIQKRHIKNSRIEIGCVATMYSIYFASHQTATPAEIITTTVTPFTRAPKTTAYPKHRVLVNRSQSLENASIIVPEAIERGKSAEFKCLYDLQNLYLYQVKWYRGVKEFCRYTPREVPHLKIFPIAGIEVDRERSDAKRLTISAATQRAQGRYTCEISVGAPSFTTVQLHGFMYVVVLPKSYPDLILIDRRYKPGMKLKVECISPDSIPPANLSFYINDKPALSEHVWHRVSGSENGSLWTAYSTLQFVIQKHHIVDYGIRIRCIAMIYSIFYKSSEFVVQGEMITTTMAPVTRRGPQRTTAYPKHRILVNRASSNRKILWAVTLMAVTRIAYGQHSLG